MKQIKAKFASKCSETGATIRKGDVMIYDYSSRKCYSIHSDTGKKFIEDEDQRQEDRSMSNYINDVLEYNYNR